MTARTWPQSVLGGGWYESARERVRAFYYWLSLRHPWAWRVRLDLVLALNFLLAFLWLTLGAVTTQMSAAEDARNLAFYVVIPPALGAALYWAYAVTKGVRVRTAAKLGTAPGPVVAVAVSLTFGCWAIAAIVTPHVYVPRDPFSGRELSSLVSYVPPDEADAVRKEFRSLARRADLWATLTFNIRSPHWHDGDDPQHKALHAFAMSQERWQRSLEALPKWRKSLPSYLGGAANPALANPQLRREFLNSTAFDRAVINAVVVSELSYSSPQERARLPPEVRARVRPGIDVGLEQIVDGATASKLFADFDAATADGKLEPPPSFNPEVWGNLREARFTAFAASRSSMSYDFVYSNVGSIDVALMKALRDNFGRLDHDLEARRAYLLSDEYKRWRNYLPQYLGVAGAFDSEIRHSESFVRYAKVWRDALLEESRAPEMVLEQELGQLRGACIFGLLGVLSLGLFAASVNKVGMRETLVSLGVFVAATGVTSAVALGAYYAAFKAETVGETMLMYGSLFVLSILIALAPLAASLVRHRHIRRSVTMALAAVWGVTAFAPFILLGVDVLSVASYSPYYYSRYPGYLLQSIELPNGTATAMVQVALWLLIAVGFAALVHALLARLAALPRPS